MRKVSGSRPDGVQEEKGKKKAEGAWVIWRRKREKNGARGRRESAKRQRAIARYSAQSNPLLFIR